MSNETFLISIRQNNDLSDVAVAELRNDLDLHPLNQRLYTSFASMPGNARKYAVNQMKTQVGPLTGKKILFLGSSVTLGFGALGESFVDYLWKMDGVEAIKDAENGTTLVDKNTSYPGDSYLERFREDLKEVLPDMLVIQLSTNDARLGNSTIGEVKDKDFDTQTVIGSLQTIITEAQKKWNCPIVIFTNPYFENPTYAKMVEKTRELSEKYRIELIDLFNNQDFKSQSNLYMVDQVHPTRAGYLEKWLPVFEKKLVKYFK